MAAKRVSKSMIDWAKMADKVPANQKSNFLSFKGKSDSYLRKVHANPEAPPKLDWATYQSKVGVAGMVDTFQKSYDAYKVPFPEDKYTSLVDAQEKQVKDDIAKYVADSNKRISEYTAELKKLESLIPYEQMTAEEFTEAFPQQALDPINRPTFWPHEPEDQIGYKPPTHGAVKEGSPSKEAAPAH